MSHTVLLGQCRGFLREHGIATRVGADTAGSAEAVAKAGDRSLAALASELAGEIYGLDVLARHIEDQSHNTTRFLVMAPEPRPAPVEAALTTFVFRVRNIPAALYKAMGGFATNGVNMTKLESYMLDGQFTATQFYADIEGHPTSRGCGGRSTSSPISPPSCSSSASTRGTRSATRSRRWRWRPRRTRPDAGAGQ